MYGFQAMTRPQGVALHMGDPAGLDLPDTPVHLRLRDAAQHAEVAQIMDAIQRELDGGRPMPNAPRATRSGCWPSGWNASAKAPGMTARAACRHSNANERLTARYTALLEREYGSALNVSDYAQVLGRHPHAPDPRLPRNLRAQRAATDAANAACIEARRLLTDTDMCRCRTSPPPWVFDTGLFLARLFGVYRQTTFEPTARRARR